MTGRIQKTPGSAETSGRFVATTWRRKVKEYFYYGPGAGAREDLPNSYDTKAEAMAAADKWLTEADEFESRDQEQ